MPKNAAVAPDVELRTAADEESVDDVIAPRRYESPDGICRLKLVNTEPYTSKFKQEDGSIKETPGKKLFVRVLEVKGDPEQTAKFGPGGTYEGAGDDGTLLSDIVGLSLNESGPKGPTKLAQYARSWFDKYLPNRTKVSFARVIAEGAEWWAMVQPDEKSDGRVFPKIVAGTYRPAKPIPAQYVEG